MNLLLRNRRVRTTVVLVSIFLVASTTSVIPAGATDVNGEYCGYRDDVQPTFSGLEWSGINADTGKSLRQLWEEGVDTWSVRDLDGTQIFTQDGPGFVVDYVSAFQIGNAGAVAACQSNPLTAIIGGVKIAVNKNNVASHRNTRTGDEYRGFAAHEWGHVLGFGHAGANDAELGGTPTMATCLADVGRTSAERFGLSSDDAAAALAGRSPIGSYQTVTPNASFEDGTQWWTKRNAEIAIGQGAAVFPGGSKASGTRHLILSPKRETKVPYITNRAIVTKMNDHWRTVNGSQVFDPTPPITINRDKIRGEVIAKKFDSSDSGSVQVQVSGRALDLADLSGQGRTECNFYSDDKNAPAVRVGPWVTRSTYCAMETFWKQCYTPATRITKQKAGFNDLDAAEVKIRVHNRVVGPNGRAAVAIARTQAEVDFVA